MSWEGLNPPYSTIVADPPWSYGTDERRWASGNRDRTYRHLRFSYTTMSVAEIAALAVAQLCAPHCWLFLWTTNRHIFHCPEILDAWGFTYRQSLVWRKTGGVSPFGGTLAPNHAEFLIVAAHGRPRVMSRLPASVIEAPKAQQHSTKPAAVLDAIEKAVAGPYVELFARQPRLGWDSWGWGYETNEGPPESASSGEQSPGALSLVGRDLPTATITKGGGGP